MAAPAAAKPLKIIAGADSFGCTLRDALVSHLRSLHIDVEDLGTSAYYSVAAEVGRRVSSSSDPSVETRGLLACGTGVGVGIIANKFPGVFAATCLTPGDAANARSINNCNVLAVSGMSTSPETAVEILKTWLSTPFNSPCPASNSAPWSPDIAAFLDNSLAETPKIGLPDKNDAVPESTPPCQLCNLVKDRSLEPIDIIPGGSMKILRESPTSAIVSFKAGSVEPAHHHTFGHDLVVIKGRKKVWNLSKKTAYELGPGDYLFTPAPDVHRVQYFEDTEFFIKWEGKWDLMFDEELDKAKQEVEKGGDDAGFDLIK
ncbi:hypothetical protein Tsubulata_000683 [Turnera subulata]|uniref:Uncharacterized protein n=1 Tax=Turnera subulata TaxID=218843 RepID=A0A9Q0FGP1_9ROSI|nr:hypothetical protein Tsubulata_000683 [Turnera subulata]